VLFICICQANPGPGMHFYFDSLEPNGEPSISSESVRNHQRLPMAAGFSALLVFVFEYLGALNV
jgi:hypothetical protein